MKNEETKSSPQEFIFEIFSCLPIKSLMCYRCAFKFYNSLVLESNFLDIHYHHSMNRPDERKYLMYKENVFYATELKEDRKSPFFRNFDQFNDNCPDFFCLIQFDLLMERCTSYCNFNTREVRFLLCPKEFVMRA